MRNLNSKGFSLVEMMVAVLLMGVLALFMADQQRRSSIFGNKSFNSGNLEETRESVVQSFDYFFRRNPASSITFVQFPDNTFLAQAPGLSGAIHNQYKIVQAGAIALTTDLSPCTNNQFVPKTNPQDRVVILCCNARMQMQVGATLETSTCRDQGLYIHMTRALPPSNLEQCMPLFREMYVLQSGSFDDKKSPNPLQPATKPQYYIDLWTNVGDPVITEEAQPRVQQLPSPRLISAARLEILETAGYPPSDCHETIPKSINFK